MFAFASRLKLRLGHDGKEGPLNQAGIMFGSRATGTAGIASGLGPRDAGKNPPNGGLAGSGPSTGVKAALTATSPGVGPISGWKKAKITPTGVGSTAGAMTTVGATAGITAGITTGMTTGMTTGITDP